MLKVSLYIYRVFGFLWCYMAFLRVVCLLMTTWQPWNQPEFSREYTESQTKAAVQPLWE